LRVISHAQHGEGDAEQVRARGEQHAPVAQGEAEPLVGARGRDQIEPFAAEITRQGQPERAASGEEIEPLVWIRCVDRRAERLHARVECFLLGGEAEVHRGQD
jgi:hypothetical protein